MNVNGIQLTLQEEELFKQLLDIGMDTITEDESTYKKAEKLMKKLGLFQ